MGPKIGPNLCKTHTRNKREKELRAQKSFNLPKFKDTIPQENKPLREKNRPKKNRNS